MSSTWESIVLKQHAQNSLDGRPAGVKARYWRPRNPQIGQTYLGFSLRAIFGRSFFGPASSDSIGSVAGLGIGGLIQASVSM